MAKTRFIDVLCDGIFITTLSYTFTPPIDLQDVYNAAIRKAPKLKGKKLELYFD